MSRALLALVAGLLVTAQPASAQDAAPRVVEVELTPVRRAQIAVWIERADGTYLRTLALTQATAVRGVGNRPGASQMNSGYNWPYGRREGVLPVWGHRRAAAPGATPFSRVIFQDRTSEGWASRSSNDFSRDDYYCLSFTQSVSGRDNLDAVTCPSVFNSDKGRYLREADLARGYAEPYETGPGAAMMRPLDTTSIYPPRRDVTRCTSGGCYDHADVELFARDARAAMPEIDAVTMATPPEGVRVTLPFTVPEDWADGDYVIWVEVNTEGDYNEVFNAATLPTPRNPSGEWDFWAMTYGYPYRGQPSVVFRVPLTIGGGALDTGAREPAGYGALDGDHGDVVAMDGNISNDPTRAPGSGADRLFLVDGQRVRVGVIGPEVCEANAPPSAVEGLTMSEHAEQRHAHRFAHLSFLAASDDVAVTRYEVRVGQEPIVDLESFMRALPARAATLEHEALVVPVNPRPGERIDVDLGGLTQQTHYYVAVRALDRCNAAGPIAVVEHTTPAIHFTTVSPCFVATAAYGTPLAAEIGALRRLRDRHLASHAPGRALVALYEAVGPHLADAIREEPALRAAARTLLTPVVALARWLE
ncbi:MAG: hypothetical protein KF729_02610 [Sandaracinaceae bacterium]|nr:hypothetical protein [Sandaracinaceae bacterium]